WYSSVVRSEDEVRGYWRANVRARVGSRGPDRRNTVREHGAADGVRGLWPAPEDINAVLSGKRSPAKQQYGSPEGQHQQLSHRIFLLLSPDNVTTTSGCGIGSKQFVPTEMK